MLIVLYHCCIENLLNSAIANSLLKPISFCLALCNYCNNTNFPNAKLNKLHFSKKCEKFKSIFTLYSTFVALDQPKEKI